MVVKRAEYTTSVLLEWVRNNAPNLRIVKTIIDGKRWCGARFEFAGELHEVESGGDEPEADVALQCAELIRAAMHLPPLVGRTRARELEEAVLTASLNGDAAGAEALSRELVLERQASAMYVRTSFGRRGI